MNTIQQQIDVLYHESCNQYTLACVDALESRPNNREKFYSETIDKIIKIIMDIFKDPMCNENNKSDFEIMCENNVQYYGAHILSITQEYIRKTVIKYLDKCYDSILSKRFPNEK